MGAPLHSHSQSSSGLEAIIHWLALLFSAVLMAISPFALNAVGWNYDGVDGSAFTRFHPATIIALLLTLIIHLRSGNPVAGFAGALMRDLSLSIFLCAWAVLLFHASANQERPAAALVDTFLLPVLVILMVRAVRAETRAGFALIIHGVFFLNAVIGIGEFLTGLRLTPYVAGGIHITDDWRSSALLGHPLGNALLTGCYVALLILGAGKELQGPIRLGMIVLQFAGMVAFGGRVSLVLLLLFGAYGMARAAFRFLAGGRLHLVHLSLLALAMPLGLAALGGLYEFGFFDKFILRFFEDKGSTQARIVMFELFNGFTMPELMFGPQPAQLAYLVRLHGIEFGIESLWVAFLLYYGIVPSLIFFTGLVFFIASLMAGCRAYVGFVLLYFFLVNTTFLGLGGKTVSFAALCLMMLVLAPREAVHASSTLRGYEPGTPRERPLPC